jgi:hypothetical protein
MDMLKGDQIAEANLTDWRKLAQGLHAGRCWCCPAADTPFHPHQAGGGLRGGSGRTGVRQPAQVTRGERVRQGPEHGGSCVDEGPTGWHRGSGSGRTASGR